MPRHVEGQGGDRIKCACMKGVPRFQTLAVKSRIKSSSVLEQSMPSHSSLSPLICHVGVTVSASSYEILVASVILLIPALAGRYWSFLLQAERGAESEIPHRLAGTSVVS